MFISTLRYLRILCQNKIKLSRTPGPETVKQVIQNIKTLHLPGLSYLLMYVDKTSWKYEIISHKCQIRELLAEKCYNLQEFRVNIQSYC